MGFKAPDNIAADRIWVFPDTSGSSNQVVKTDGSGNLGWLTPATATVADAIVDVVTDIAPSQNAVFDALALKVFTTGDTMSGAINMGATKITQPCYCYEPYRCREQDLRGWCCCSLRSQGRNSADDCFLGCRQSSDLRRGRILSRCNNSGFALNHSAGGSRHSTLQYGRGPDRRSSFPRAQRGHGTIRRIQGPGYNRDEQDLRPSGSRWNSQSGFENRWLWQLGLGHTFQSYCYTNDHQWCNHHRTFRDAVFTALTAKISKAGDSMTGDLAMGNSKITGLATPTAGTDAATMGYADSVVALYAKTNGSLAMTGASWAVGSRNLSGVGTLGAGATTVSSLTSSGAATGTAFSTSAQAGFTVAPYSTAASATGEMRFSALSGGNYVGFRAPDSIAANTMWNLPAADGTANQVLKTDAAGNLAWVSPSSLAITQTINSGYDWLRIRWCRLHSLCGEGC